MGRSCSKDHTAMTASLDAFIVATYHVGVQHFGHGIPPQLLGNCPECASTLAIELCDCRNNVIRSGTIETSPKFCAACLNSMAAEAVNPRPDPNDDDRRIS